MAITNSGAVMIGATVSAAIILVFFFKAPVLPVAVGVIVATLINIRRSRGT